MMPPTSPTTSTITPPLLDLGHLAGSILLFGGPYSNLQATLALREQAEHLAIPSDRVICTGDVVAYCAEPAETINAIRDWGCHVVMGNCEEALAEGGDDCRCGFEKGSECDLLAVKWFAHASSQISVDQRTWMANLPHPVTFQAAERRFAVVHGHARDLSEWVFASTPKAEKQAALEALGVDAIIAGHSGLPFTQELAGGRVWHNPGVIGVPANDGTPRVWYSLIIPTADGIVFEHRALDYDHKTAADRMIDTGLPDAYARSLSTGLWPNLDVLPTDEAAATGKPLDPGHLTWNWPRRRVA